MQWYLVVIFALTLLSALLVFYAYGLLSSKKNKTSLKGKEDNEHKANDELANIKREITIATKDKHSADCESFKTSAKLSFIYKEDNKSNFHAVTVNRFSRENGLTVIEGYSGKTNKQERFLENLMSGCVDIETGRKIGNLTVFLKLRKPGLKRLPPAASSTVMDFSAMLSNYEPNISVTKPSSSGGTYLIDYEDAGGEITSRTITINKIYRDNSATYIDADCHLRRETRTFRLDRIVGYITDTRTGELLDPDVLSPLKNKIIIPLEKTKSATHLAISYHARSWFVFQPQDKVSRIADRAKLGLTPYRYQIDAYRTAINKTIENDTTTLFLYVCGKYYPSKTPENADKIDIIQLDTSTYEGKNKIIWLRTLFSKENPLRTL